MLFIFGVTNIIATPGIAVATLTFDWFSVNCGAEPRASYPPIGCAKLFRGCIRKVLRGISTKGSPKLSKVVVVVMKQVPEKVSDASMSRLSRRVQPIHRPGLRPLKQTSRKRLAVARARPTRILLLKVS